MGYEIIYSKQANKYLDSQPLAISQRIEAAIENLPAGNVKKMQGRRGYRLKIGDFRVVFDYENETTITVLYIASRGDVYKK